MKLERRLARSVTGSLFAAAFSFALGRASAVEPAAAGSEASVNLELAQDCVRISVAGLPLGEFVFRDPNIGRPYLTHVKAPGGVPVTRNHPPIAGEDRPDHSEFHPGIWLTFGDLGGQDYWRLKATTRHAGFEVEPYSGPGRGGFVSRNLYLAGLDPPAGAAPVCRELLQFKVCVRPQGTLLIWDSTFSGDAPFWFGDQEEMGLGVRMATVLRAEGAAGGLPAGTGEIVDAEGRRNEAGVARRAARWCDYRGVRDGQHVGVAIFSHPENFRPSWHHARDYGLLVANPFARKTLADGELSRVEVAPGETFRLRFGVLLHGEPAAATLDLDAAYADYVKLATDR